jgi:hypothetical protein
MGKFLGLLLLPLVVAFAQAVLAAVFMGNAFGYSIFELIVVVPFTYIPTLLVGLPVIGSATELPRWRSALVGVLCAVPAGYVFLDWQSFTSHMLSVCVTYASWLAAGAFLGEKLVFRRGIVKLPS